MLNYTSILFDNENTPAVQDATWTGAWMVPLCRDERWQIPVYVEIIGTATIVIEGRTYSRSTPPGRAERRDLGYGKVPARQQGQHPRSCHVGHGRREGPRHDRRPDGVPHGGSLLRNRSRLMGDTIRLRSSVAGKGDKARPSTVSERERAHAYCRIFGHQWRREKCRNCGVPITMSELAKLAEARRESTQR
jgi:hypothetical protein